jgi:hypothetical protein
MVASFRGSGFEALLFGIDFGLLLVSISEEPVRNSQTSEKKSM